MNLDRLKAAVAPLPTDLHEYLMLPDHIDMWAQYRFDVLIAKIILGMHG
jgi:hypothetical protein